MFLIEFAEHHDCIYVNAYARAWIVGPDGEKLPDPYVPIIEAVSRPGDLICDPCMGSGAIGIAALTCGRDYIGIEMRSQRHLQARKRLRDFENAKASGD